MGQQWHGLWGVGGSWSPPYAGQWPLCTGHAVAHPILRGILRASESAERWSYLPGVTCQGCPLDRNIAHTLVQAPATAREEFLVRGSGGTDSQHSQFSVIRTVISFNPKGYLKQQSGGFFFLTLKTIVVRCGKSYKCQEFLVLPLSNTLRSVEKWG